MRVLMYCPKFAPVIGGAERQAEKLGMTLRDRGVDVRVLTPMLDSITARCEVRGGVLPVRRFYLSDLSNRFPRVRGIGLINAPWIALQIFWQVWREARRADVVHCHIGSLQSVAAAYAARLRRRPIICKAAMADDRSDLGEAEKFGLTGRIVARLGRTAFTKWIATTQAVRDALLRAGVQESRIVIVPNGVEFAENQSTKLLAPVRRFLYLGRLSTNTERDVPGLISAFDQLADMVVDAQLAIVGGGDLLKETRALATACRHGDRIQVPGPGNPEEWFSWADCFVLPSRREGLSNALLEAMAEGLPCIANDIPPNREVLAAGEAGVLVPVGDTSQLCVAMSELCANLSRADYYRIRARARVEAEYSLTSVAIRYQALYQHLNDSVRQ